MNMKLSYRDKVIFIVVIILIILVAGFFLFIKPKFEDIEKAKYNLEQTKQQKVEIETKIATLPTIIENIKAVADEIGEKQEIFMAEQDPYLNEIYIREALTAEGLEIREMNTTYAEAGPIDRYIVEAKNLLAYGNKMSADLYNELPQEVYDLYEEAPAKEYANTEIGVTIVDATFAGGLDPIREAKKAMDRIAKDDKTIILNSISSTTENLNEEEEPVVTAKITIYSIFPLNVEQVKQETADIKPIETTEEPVA